ncbi:MAG: SusD/RagB family nutrient-binding outer membrane lipoprotein [Chitinophagaceae bacterium]|nr:SusD/RagB family nutrient-binding outer membrane lipoprotein [Chitinophagaceae bacterium]
MGWRYFYTIDLAKWKKLANSLQLRYLMRISNKKSVATDMQAIINGTDTPVLEVIMITAPSHITVSPNQFPLHTTGPVRLTSFV